jgi:hypothetical protein
MGFSLTSPAPEKGDPTAKNRVWGFFGDAQEMHRANRPQSLQPRQGNRLTTTKIALGRTYWPSRDPIGERGGMNLYGMVGNDVVNFIDLYGESRWSKFRALVEAIVGISSGQGDGKVETVIDCISDQDKPRIEQPAGARKGGGATGGAAPPKPPRKGPGLTDLLPKRPRVKIGGGLWGIILSTIFGSSLDALADEIERDAVDHISDVEENFESELDKIKKEHERRNQVNPGVTRSDHYRITCNFNCTFLRKESDGTCVYGNCVAAQVPLRFADLVRMANSGILLSNVRSVGRQCRLKERLRYRSDYFTLE